MLPHIALALGTLAAAALADVLIVPPHRRYSGWVGTGSIDSDSEIIAELDYGPFDGLSNSTSPSGVDLFCPDCPLVFKDSNGNKNTFQSSQVENAIAVVFDTANNRLNLNGNPFLGPQMEDLHLPQTTNQIGLFADEDPDAYTGPIPITYNVKVVQVRIVKLEDGSLIQFYSIDVVVLSFGEGPLM